MNEQEFYKRVGQVFRPEALKRKRAVVVGVGSGGSRVATELGRLGVGQVLIDRPGERLEEHNIIRHELGYDSLGKLKLSELARHIRNFNSATPIECVELDVTAQPEAFLKLVERTRPDLLLACTDNQQSKHVVDTAGVRFGIPTAGAGVYDGGVGGEVYVTRPGAACYGCIAAHLQLKRHTAEKPANIDYSNLDLDELRSTAALNTEISQIALIHARVALNLLLAGESDLLGLPPEINLVVFANRCVPGHFARPLHAEFYHLARRPDCLVCGRLDPNADLEARRILSSLRT